MFASSCVIILTMAALQVKLMPWQSSVKTLVHISHLSSNPWAFSTYIIAARVKRRKVFKSLISLREKKFSENSCKLYWISQPPTTPSIDPSFSINQLILHTGLYNFTCKPDKTSFIKLDTGVLVFPQIKLCLFFSTLSYRQSDNQWMMKNSVMWHHILGQYEQQWWQL